MATAAAFLREYLTIDDAAANRPGRVGRYLARGVDLDGGVVPGAGVTQSADLVLPAGVQPLEDGFEVTVFAHLLQGHRGQAANDGGTVAFVVPVVEGPRGMAVSGPPRPSALPIDPSLSTPAVALPATLARTVAAMAGKAVAALLSGDRATLDRLGGGVAPTVQPFPEGWRPIAIADIRPAGPPENPTVQVLVRARPPAAGVEYLVPVRVVLSSGPGPSTVREIDAGATR